MGVHSWKRTSLESLISVYNIWNAIFGSKFGGFFVPRKSCEWIRSFDKDVCGLRAYHWFRFTSKGISWFLMCVCVCVYIYICILKNNDSLSVIMTIFFAREKNMISFLLICVLIMHSAFLKSQLAELLTDEFLCHF